MVTEVKSLPDNSNTWFILIFMSGGYPSFFKMWFTQSWAWQWFLGGILDILALRLGLGLETWFLSSSLVLEDLNWFGWSCKFSCHVCEFWFQWHFHFQNLCNASDLHGATLAEASLNPMEYQRTQKIEGAILVSHLSVASENKSCFLANHVCFFPFLIGTWYCFQGCWVWHSPVSWLSTTQGSPELQSLVLRGHMVLGIKLKTLQSRHIIYPLNHLPNPVLLLLKLTQIHGFRCQKPVLPLTQ